LVFGWLAMAAVAIRNYTLVEAPDLKRRVRWTFYGTLVGILPSSFAFVLIFLSGATSSDIFNDHFIRTVNFIGQITLPVIPISVGYEVMKYRLFDINLVIRRSLHYLFAKNVLRVLIYLPVVLILNEIRQNPDQSLSQILFSNTQFLMISIAAVAGFAFRKN